MTTPPTVEQLKYLQKRLKRLENTLFKIRQDYIKIYEKINPLAIHQAEQKFYKAFNAISLLEMEVKSDLMKFKDNLPQGG